MKVSIIVLLALIVLPIFLHALGILYKFLTKGVEGIDSLTKPNLRVSPYRRKLTYGLVLVYLLMVMAVIFWVFLEVDSGLGKDRQYYFITTIAVLILVFIMFIWIFHRFKKLINKLPYPPAGSSDKVIADWNDKTIEENSAYLTRFTEYISGYFTRHTKLVLITIIGGVTLLLLYAIVMIITNI
jgi:hypothetical protein